MSDSLRPHEPPHARPPCPLPTPGVYPNSCPSSRWRHPTISSSVVPVSSCPQSLPASGSFPMSQLLTWAGQDIGVSASASVLPMNTQDWSPLGWTGWISLPDRTLRSLLQHHSSRASILQRSAFFTVQLSHPYMTTGKTIALTRRTFAGKVMSLLFNINTVKNKEGPQMHLPASCNNSHFHQGASVPKFSTSLQKHKPFRWEEIRFTLGLLVIHLICWQLSRHR